MILSGLNFRSLPEYDEWSHDSIVSLSDVSGTGFLGFSGSGVGAVEKQVGYKFLSGKIYDFEDNYIFSYSKDSLIKISGDIFPTSYTSYINSVPINFSGQKDYFRLGQIVYDTDRCKMNVETNIHAKEFPNYDFDLPESFQAGNAFTGYLIDKDPNFRVFSGELYNGYYQLFNISGLPTGGHGKIGPNQLSDGMLVIETGEDNIDLGNYELTLRLMTDWGTINKDLVLTINNPSLGTIRTTGWTQNSNAIALTGDPPLKERSNEYTLTYSINKYGVETNKNLQVSLEYTGDPANPSTNIQGGTDYIDGYRTGHFTGFQGNILWLDSGSGYDVNSEVVFSPNGSGDGTGAAASIILAGSAGTTPYGDAHTAWSVGAGSINNAVTVTATGFNYMTGDPGELYHPLGAGYTVIPVLATGVGSGSGNWFLAGNGGGGPHPEQGGASGLMLLEQYIKSFENSWDLETGVGSYYSSFGDNSYTSIETVNGIGNQANSVSYDHVTGYRQDLNAGAPIEYMDLSYKHKKLTIRVDNKNYYDTRSMFALLTVSGEGDDNEGPFLFKFPITGVK